MSSTLFAYFVVNIFMGFVNLMGLTAPKDPLSFAQKMVISYCALGAQLVDTCGLFLLWFAAVLVGIKYKHTSLKIYAAVCETGVAKREIYRRVRQQYGTLIALSVFLWAYWIVCLPLVDVYGYDDILFIIGGGIGLILIFSLAVMYLLTFRELKRTLEKTSEHRLSICTQIVYIALLTVLASLQMSLSFT